MGGMVVKHQDLEVYKKAFEAAMHVFRESKTFPKEEVYSLSDQIRRSPRSVCANLAEAWRKRRYLAAFVSKLNDAETETAETQVHLEVALRHRYITSETFENLDDACDKVLGQIVSMIDHADRWIIKPRRQISNG